MALGVRSRLRQGGHRLGPWTGETYVGPVGGPTPYLSLQVPTGLLSPRVSSGTLKVLSCPEPFLLSHITRHTCK